MASTNATRIRRPKSLESNKTMLLTVAQRNIEQYFIPGKELVTFNDENDCLEKIRYYLTQEEERAMIAKAGQERTLRDHGFVSRARTLVEEIAKLK